MLSLPEVGPELNTNQHMQDEPTSKTKKRPRSKGVLEPPSAKRLKVSKDVIQSPKKPKALSVPGPARVSVAKAKGTNFENSNSGKPKWLMVVYSDVDQGLSDLEPVDIRPRLWSSTREELGSTFVEISGSKCVNNISWALTDMPVLILDNGSMSLEKPKDVDDGLYMDLVLTREFIRAAPSVPQGDGDISVMASVVEVQPGSVLEGVVPSPPSASSVPAFDLQKPQHPTTESSGNPASEKPPPSGSSAQRATIAPGPSAAAAAPKSNSKSKRSQPKQQRAPETTAGESLPDSASQPPRKPRPTRPSTGVPPSLRFKKNKSASSKPPPVPEVSQYSPNLPQPSPGVPSPPAPAGQPHSVGENILHPPEQRALQSSHREKHQQPCCTPDTPMQELDTIIQTQSNFEPDFHHYPGNRSLPNFTKFPRTFAEKHDLALSNSSTYYPVEEFKIELTECAVAPVIEPEVSPETEGVIRVSSIIACQCSRFRYDPGCRVCCCCCGGGGDNATSDLTSPIVDSSAQLNGRGELAGKHPMHMKQRRTSPSPATYPNDIALVQPKPWSKPRDFNEACERRPSTGVPQTVHTNHQSSAPFVTPRPANILPSTNAGDSELSRLAPSSRSVPVLAPVAIAHTARAAFNVPLTSNASHSSNPQMIVPPTVAPAGWTHAQARLVPSTQAAVLPHPIQATKGPVTDEHPTLTPSDKPTLTNDDTISPSLKRKGKEKVRILESSSDEEPLAARLKKIKLSHGPIINGHKVASTQSHGPIACSSKTTLEDLPILRPTSPQVPVQNELRVSKGSGPPVEELPPPSTSIIVKPLKRRGRPPKPSKVVSETTLTTRPIPMEVVPKEEVVPPELQLQPPSLSSSKPKTRSKPKSHVEPPPTPAAPVQWGENGVPLPIPDETRTLINAYVNSTPIGIFAARRHLQNFWRLKLVREEEIGYAFMGFYRVSRVLENLEGGNVVSKGNGKDEKEMMIVEDKPSKARVCWRFRLKWEPGGEGWQIRDPRRLTSPWWNPDLKAQGLSTLPQPDLDDSDDESTLAHRLARRTNPNFARRHCYFDQAFCSVLPLHLLAPINAEIPDTTLPRGWHCEDCGKLNFRYYLRHRRCRSSYCQDKPETEGYTVDIDRMRDPQDSLPLSLPLNEIPTRIRLGSRVYVWADKMRTLVYQFEAGPPVVQHVFTCNLRELQEVPSELLNSIQMDVPLKRSTGEPNPYFIYSVGDTSGRDEEFVAWEAAPKCLQHVKELMNSRGRKYGRKTARELDITKLVIRAWVTAGSKRGSDLLCASQRCMVIMCLGCEVIISINPKSAIVPSNHQARMPDLDKLIPMESFDPQEDQMTKTGPREGVKSKPGAMEDDGDQVHAAPTPPVRRGINVKSSKGERAELTISLVHGDALVLEGDDFEYSVKRTGTSILLFGS